MTCGDNQDLTVHMPFQTLGNACTDQSAICLWPNIMLNGLGHHHRMLMLQDQDMQRPLTAAAAKKAAEMADKDLAKLIVLTPSRKNGLDGKSGSHSHHAASAITEGLCLFDEVHLLLMLILSTSVCGI